MCCHVNNFPQPKMRSSNGNCPKNKTNQNKQYNNYQQLIKLLSNFPLSNYHLISAVLHPQQIFSFISILIYVTFIDLILLILSLLYVCWKLDRKIVILSFHHPAKGAKSSFMYLKDTAVASGHHPLILDFWAAVGVSRDLSSHWDTGITCRCVQAESSTRTGSGF